MRDAAFLQITDIGLAAQKPEQLVNDRFEMQLFGREQGKILPQIEARLRAENRKRARCRCDPSAVVHSRARAGEDRDIRLALKIFA